MKGKFIIRMHGEVIPYTDFESIPDQIGAVISFMPDIPEPPHTEEEHELIHAFHDKLQELIKRESCQLR
jgi:hypothetical protein